jgi:hypothetical protein
MLPFDDYPGKGRQLLGPVHGANCRREYGLAFMRKARQTTCAYCGQDLVATYQSWLTMALDHVVPVSVCISLGIPAEWREDCSNKVLCCAACNGFANRYKPTIDPGAPASLDTFYALRDHIFAERKQLIAERHESEREFFELRRWEQP